MSNTKFTEGPWFTFNVTHSDSKIVTCENREGMVNIAEVPFAVPDSDCSFEQEQTHNANLIAASPLLYKALEGVLELAVSLIDDSHTWDAEEEPRVIAARKALASAKG